MRNRRKPRSTNRGLMIALCVVLAITLVALIVLAISLHLYETYKGKINYVENTGVEQSDIYQQLQQSGALMEDDEKVINILLIGQDAREGETRQRSDSMILCTINQHTDTLTMTSFMRDMYVEIPGYSANRINAAYQLGGMELIDLCLLHNFGVVVDYNIEIDFKGFMKAVDAVGGIDVELNADEANYLNANGNWGVNESSAWTWNLKEGVNHLTGEQTLAYCRIRYVGNADFGRTERQRKVLSILMDKCKTLSIFELNDLMHEVLPLVTTDMSPDQIDKYVQILLPEIMKLKTQQLRIPADGAYVNNTENWTLIPDLEKNREILSDTINN